MKHAMDTNATQITSTVTQQVIGEFHPFLVFLPILFFTAALIADLFYYYGKKKAFIWGHWLVVLGWISCMPTVLTGLYAAFNFETTNAVLAEHRFLGYTTAIAASAFAGLRISTIFWNIPLLPSHFVWFSIIMCALVSWTSDYGLMLEMDVNPIPEMEELKNTT